MKSTCDVCEKTYSKKSREKCPRCNSKITRPNFVSNSIYIRRSPPFSLHRQDEYNREDGQKITIKQFLPLDDPSKDDARWPRISIKNSEQLVKFLEGLNALRKELGWVAKSEILDEIDETRNDEESQEKLEKLLDQYPSFLNEVLETVDFEDLDDKDFELLKEILENLNKTTLRAERRIKEQFSNLLEKLTDQGEGFKQLASLLEDWHLIQVTSTSNVALERLEFLDTFEEMIHNDKVYEIKGDDSIHRSLERNLWILNEEYWLLQSNKSLRKFVQKEFDESDSGAEKRRPDFVCAAQGDELVIAEIKRPSHELKKDDVEQLDDYFYYAQKYRGKDFSDIKGFLIGNKFSERAKRRAESHESIEIKTYNEILTNARNRYREYLDALEESEKILQN